MKFYFISADNSDGESLDLFVWATTTEEAKVIWKEQFDLDDESEFYGDLFEVPSQEPASPTSLDWHTTVKVVEHITQIPVPA